jgi:hypothetical protein
MSTLGIDSGGLDGQTGGSRLGSGCSEGIASRRLAVFEEASYFFRSTRANLQSTLHCGLRHQRQRFQLLQQFRRVDRLEDIGIA